MDVQTWDNENVLEKFFQIPGKDKIYQIVVTHNSFTWEKNAHPLCLI